MTAAEPPPTIAPPVTSDPTGEPIQLVYRLRASEYGRAMIEMAQQSVGSVTIGSAIVAMGAWTFLQGDGASLVLVIFGVAVASGLYSVPFVLWAARRRPDLLLGQHEVRIDADGVTVTTATTSARQGWATFKRLRELTDVILLDYGTGANALLPLRAFDRDELARFRRFAGERYATPSRWGNLLKGILGGVIAAIAWFFAIVVLVSVTG